MTVDNNGTIKALNPGSATITAVSNDGGFVATTKVTVEALSKKVTSVSIDKKELTYIAHEVNKNASVARNTGFGISSGEYVMFLDDDDEFTCDRIEKQLASLESLDDKWGASYCSFVKVEKNGNFFAKTARWDLGMRLICASLIRKRREIFCIYTGSISFSRFLH